MTNDKIITNELKTRGMTDSEIQQLRAANNGDLPFHTFAQWKKMGYSVKRGEHALFWCYLWKYTNKPGRAAREAAEVYDMEVQEDDPHYYKAKSYIFSFAQVKPIGQPDPDPEAAEAPAPCVALVPAPCMALVPHSC